VLLLLPPQAQDPKVVSGLWALLSLFFFCFHWPALLFCYNLGTTFPDNALLNLVRLAFVYEMSLLVCYIVIDPFFRL